MEAFNQDVERILKKAEKTPPTVIEHTAEKQQEIIREVITKEVGQGVGEQESASAIPGHAQVSVGLEYDSVPAYSALPEDEKEQVRGYVERVRNEGIVNIARQAKKKFSDDPAALDAFYDTIAFVVQQEAQGGNEV